MTAEMWADAGRMLVAGLIVAAVAVPVGAVGWWFARRRGTPLLPQPGIGRAPWSGYEVALAFLGVSFFVPALVYAGLEGSAMFDRLTSTTPADLSDVEHRAERSVARGVWAGVIALPFQLALLAIACRSVYPSWSPGFRGSTVPPRIAIGVLAWAVLTPPVLAVHAGVNLTFASLGLPTDDHPLSKLSGDRPAIDHVLFVIQAAVAAPLIEEVLFRGVLLMWLVSRPAEQRVWPALGVSVLVSVGFSGNENLITALSSGPAIFAGVLVAGWFVVRRFTRKRRTVGAVYASAALFAVVHSSVWPTPIPLFVLGLGLGWCAIRTGGITAPFVVHGLFNAVSAVYVLRGAGG